MSFVLQSRIPALQATLRRRAEAVVKKTTHDVEAEIKLSMAEPKHGRIYKRGKKTHQASAPGEAPAIDTTALASSIHAQTDGLTGVVGTNLETGPLMEFGGVKVDARPFMSPAIEAARPGFEAAVKQLGGP